MVGFPSSYMNWGCNEAIAQIVSRPEHVCCGCSVLGLLEPGGGDSVLTVWTFKQSEIKALEAAGADWGKQNNMTVKVSVYTPDDAYRTKIQAAAKSKTLPDIISIHSQGGDWKLAQAGIVQDITDDFTSSWQDQLLPGVIKGATL